MKCLSCDKVLSDFEATRKYKGTYKFVDLCNRCFSYVSKDIYVTERWDLKHTSDESDQDADTTGHCNDLDKLFD